MRELWFALGLMGLSVGLWLGWPRLKQGDTPPSRWVAVPWIKRMAIFLYFVGIPYLALVSGILTPRLLGLKGLDYFALIDWYSQPLGVQFQQAITLTLLEWLLDSQATILAGSAALLTLVGIQRNLFRYQIEIALPQESTLFTLYYAVHWAFYRAIFWLITDDLYLAAVLGVGLVMLEGALFIQIERRWAAQRRQFWVSSIILILTAAVFYYSPNLWLLLPVHRLLAMLANKKWGTSAQPDLPNLTTPS